MNGREYVDLAIVTENKEHGKIQERLNSDKKTRILHALLGICTETGELQDQLKKSIIYGKELDEVNLVEEVGDLFWYQALLCDALEVSFEEVWEKNIAKLKARYGDKFSEHDALVRNLKKERGILED